jgi:hypothetical protein
MSSRNDSQVVLPETNVVLPETNVVLPETNVVLPETNVVLPETNVVLHLMNLRATFTKTSPAFPKTSTGIEVKSVIHGRALRSAPAAIRAGDDVRSLKLYSETHHVVSKSIEHEVRRLARKRSMESSSGCMRLV